MKDPRRACAYGGFKSKLTPGWSQLGVEQQTFRHVASDHVPKAEQSTQPRFSQGYAGRNRFAPAPSVPPRGRSSRSSVGPFKWQRSKPREASDLAKFHHARRVNLIDWYQAPPAPRAALPVGRRQDRCAQRSVQAPPRGRENLDGSAKLHQRASEEFCSIEVVVHSHADLEQCC